jgi:undecaprenyl-diphosphatase
VSGLFSTERPSFLTAVRRPAIVTVAVSAIVLVLFGVRYEGESDGRWLDDEALALVRGSLPIRRGVAHSVIELYDPLPLAMIIAVLAGACLLLGRRRLAVLAVAGPVLTGLATEVLKAVIGRTKEGDLAFPSGHMGAATALALVLALLLVSLINVRLATAVAVVAGVLLVVAGSTALAMTVSNYHYLTDIIGGFCTAVAVVLGLALLLERWPRRRGPGRRGACDAPG